MYDVLRERQKKVGRILPTNSYLNGKVQRFQSVVSRTAVRVLIIVRLSRGKYRSNQTTFGDQKW